MLVINFGYLFAIVWFKILLVAFAAIVVIYLISYWKVLVKAGLPGWIIFVPIYNIYVLNNKVAKLSTAWFVLGLASVLVFWSLVFVFLFSLLPLLFGGLSAVIILWIALLLALIILMFVWYVLIIIGFGKSFDLSTVFVVALAILPPIFILIVAFNKNISFVKSSPEEVIAV